MKWRNGSAASRSPSISLTRPSLIGSRPAVQAWSSTGCMTKKVRNSASPISTVLGGAPWVPSALRSSDSTTTMRVKAVTITSRLGASDSTVISAVSCTRREVAPAAPAAPRSMLTDCAAASDGTTSSNAAQPGAPHARSSASAGSAGRPARPARPARRPAAAASPAPRRRAGRATAAHRRPTSWSSPARSMLRRDAPGRAPSAACRAPHRRSAAARSDGEGEGGMGTGSIAAHCSRSEVKEGLRRRRVNRAFRPRRPASRQPRVRSAAAARATAGWLPASGDGQDGPPAPSICSTWPSGGWHWLNRRTAVLADNIANADTPGWQAARPASPSRPRWPRPGWRRCRTNPLHLAGTGGRRPGRPRRRRRRTRPDGNAVRLDVELTKLADTDTAQTLVSESVESYFGMFRTALGK